MWKKSLALLFAAVFAVLPSCNKEPQSASIDIDGKKEYSLSCTASVVPVKIKCSGSDWAYDWGDIGWIHEKSKSGNNLNILVDANDGSASRSARVCFYTPSTGQHKAEVTLTLTQAGKPFEPSMGVEPSSFTVEASGSAGNIVTVSTNLPSWEYDKEEDWLTVSVEGNTLSFDVAANGSEDSRSASINLYTPTKASPQLQRTVQISQKGRVIDYDPEELGLSGTANCYLISHRGQYSFKATVRGNGKTVTGLDAPAALAPKGASLVWQTTNGMITDVSYADGKITFFAERVFGNALIAATDGSGNIIWSWHIWFPNEAVSSERSSSGDDVMAYNLGALNSDHTSLGSYGLLYQWGRKDPFPGSPKMSGGSVSLENVSVYDISGKEVKITHADAGAPEIKGSHIAYATAHPTVSLGNRNYYPNHRDWMPPAESNNSLWGNPEGNVKEGSSYPNKGSKTYYDPCPPGWRVAPISTFFHITASGGMAWATGTTEDLTWGDLGGATTTAVADFNGDGKLGLEDWTCGWHIYMNRKTGMLYFPATTRYDGQYAMFMGSMVGLWGNYWYNTGTDSGMGMALAFGIKEYNSQDYSISISPTSAGSRADAYSVRCIKE